MKKLVTTPLTNTIWWATVNEEKGIITGDKNDVTDNAIDAVFQRLIRLDKFKETGFAGYEIPKKNSEDYVTMAVFKSDTYVCVEKKLYEELLEYKRKYDDLVSK